MSGDYATEVIFKAQKENVYRAIELLRPKNVSHKRKHNEQEDDEEHKMINYCSSAQSKEWSGSVIVSGFTKHLLIQEMRSSLLSHNWKHIQYLFPQLLSYSNHLEPVVWRYALILLLYSPYSTLSCIQHFLEMCAGTRNLSNEQIFKKLLSLKFKSTELT